MSMGRAVRSLAAMAAAAVLLGLASGGAAGAAPVRTENVETEIVPARTAAAPGETVTFVLRQKVRDGWHTYWINPGDSGLATEVTWTLPPGFAVGPLLHPAPRVERLGPITTYVHDGEILYPFAVTAPADFRGQSARLTAKVDWLVCDEICIPETATLTVDLPIRAGGGDDARGAPLAAAAIAALPSPLTALGFEFAATDAVRVAFPKARDPGNPITDAVNARRLRNPAYFPYSQSLIDHAGAQKAAIGDGGVAIEAPLSLSFQADGARGDGLLVAEIEEGGRWVRRAFMFGAPPVEGPLPAAVAAQWAGSAPPPSASGVAGGGGSAAGSGGGLGGLLAAIAAAFVGGLILNVMPCVFPVLSIKALSLAGGVQAGVAQRHGALFFAGVMATFLALALALIGLQAAGAAVGWGFQLQEPAVIAALALLFFVIGLNLVGAFEFAGPQNLGASLAGKGGDAGAFFTGALAVIAATPCTAPFMAGALGWAATQPPAASLAVFAGLGAGFAAPFTALSFAPALHRRLPRPGPWMERFRQALAFPMFGAAVWLVWVHTVQTGAGGAAALLSLFVAAAFLVWGLRQGGAWRVAGVVAVVAVAALAWRPLVIAPDAQAAQTAAADAWSPERVAELTAAGGPVFVNFTAAWCVSCKANEAVALSRPAVQDAFARAGVTTLKADWTARDPVIARELAAHGRSGVPLYLYYAPGATEPRILPQLLTEQLLIDLVAGDGAKLEAAR
ncbi:MAG: protein-disulfide reductase DsbD family protein [Hyphomonadaceae bacterium]|nr:protein-disulfide reductase DsbD family protein [Hyphomonadaceae bacterium]